MRAVNQSIGRAIRHQKDYASILLIDERYALPRINKKLSGWIRDYVRPSDKFGPCIRDIRTFFKGHAGSGGAGEGVIGGGELNKRADALSNAAMDATVTNPRQFEASAWVDELRPL